MAPPARKRDHRPASFPNLRGDVSDIPIAAKNSDPLVRRRGSKLARIVLTMSNNHLDFPSAFAQERRSLGGVAQSSAAARKSRDEEL